ncbi:MAG TPA: hypothetical protein PK442_13700, partial [Synergistales bacterium]|nr:hypothetical protein [Synergistales bacterium]
FLGQIHTDETELDENFRGRFPVFPRKKSHKKFFVLRISIIVSVGLGIGGNASKPLLRLGYVIPGKGSQNAPNVFGAPGNKGKFMRKREKRVQNGLKKLAPGILTTILRKEPLFLAQSLHQGL